MLSTELGAGGELRLISGEDVARAKSELPLVAEDSLARSTLARLRTNPGADLVVLGSYTRLAGEEPDRIRLDLRLQDTASGETLFEQAFTGSQENLFDLVAQAGARLRESLGVKPLSPQIAAASRAALPSNQLAMQLYTEGLARSRAFDFLGAREVMIKAVAADPDYPLAHSALADAWDHLGYSCQRSGRDPARDGALRQALRGRSACSSRAGTTRRSTTGPARLAAIKSCSTSFMTTSTMDCGWLRRNAG